MLPRVARAGAQGRPVAAAHPLGGTTVWMLTSASPIPSCWPDEQRPRASSRGTPAACGRARPCGGRGTARRHAPGMPPPESVLGRRSRAAGGCCSACWRRAPTRRARAARPARSSAARAGRPRGGRRSSGTSGFAPTRRDRAARSRRGRRPGGSSRRASSPPRPARPGAHPAPTRRAATSDATPRRHRATRQHREQRGRDRWAIVGRPGREWRRRAIAKKRREEDQVPRLGRGGAAELRQRERGERQADEAEHERPRPPARGRRVPRRRGDERRPASRATSRPSRHPPNARGSAARPPARRASRRRRRRRRRTGRRARGR